MLYFCWLVFFWWHFINQKCKKNKKNGYGIFYDADGSFRAGRWENDIPCAASEKYMAKIEKIYDNGKYTGAMKNDLRDGWGTYEWKDGSLYVGEWKQDQKEGRGTYCWMNGDRYVGEWKNNLMEGSGTYFYSDGSRYEGEWKDSLKHGYGVLYGPDGTFQVGEWEDNLMK